MSGMTPREAQVMDLWDNGHSMEQIAAAGIVSLPRAKAIVSTFTDTEAERHAARNTISGSAALLAAMNAAA